jgi:hypothetical protein
MTFGLGDAKVLKLKLYLKISEELECAFGVGGKILMSKI